MLVPTFKAHLHQYMVFGGCDPRFYVGSYPSFVQSGPMIASTVHWWWGWVVGSGSVVCVLQWVEGAAVGWES